MAKLTPEQMTTVKAMAPFELADIFAEWLRRWEKVADEIGMAARHLDADSIGGLGPIYPVVGEEPEEYGQRIAAGIITLLKEV